MEYGLFQKKKYLRFGNNGNFTILFLTTNSRATYSSPSGVIY